MVKDAIARAGAFRGAKVGSIEPESPAALAGLAPGDLITCVNGRRIEDFLDFYAEAFNSDLVLTVVRAGDEASIRVKRRSGQSLGADIETGRPFLCNNKCIFCFVDQMPPGLRKTLYVKDEDYRHSFLHGAYLTLTNLKADDEERIIRMNLKPLYVSVHATDEDVRATLLGRRPREALLPILDRLGLRGTVFHTQIVVVPGINDGDVLERTLSDLAARREYVRSISVVPVGLTCHRAGLYPLVPADCGLAGEIIDLVEGFRIRMLTECGAAIAYASDELFVMSAREIPPDSYYDDYPQLDNGVGLLRTLLESIKGVQLPPDLKQKRVRFITGLLAAPYIRMISNELTMKGLGVDVAVADSGLFGPSVTVSGLLSGRDILEALSGGDAVDAVVVPPNILNADGLTLDDVTISEIRDRLATPVVVGDYHVGETLNRIQNALR